MPCAALTDNPELKSGAVTGVRWLVLLEILSHQVLDPALMTDQDHDLLLKETLLFDDSFDAIDVALSHVDFGIDFIGKLRIRDSINVGHQVTQIVGDQIISWKGPQGSFYQRVQSQISRVAVG